MSNSVILFGEPELEFQYGQRVKDPRDGLSLFRPYDVGTPSQPRSINYVLIGTEEGNMKFRNWVQQINKPSIESPKDNHRLWVPFPGFEAAFQSEFLTKPVWSATINNDNLIEASHQKDEHERAFRVVNQYLEEFEKIKKLDEKIGVAICVVPDEVFQNCQSKISCPKWFRRKTIT